jgi:hypothetical protein
MKYIVFILSSIYWYHFWSGFFQIWNISQQIARFINLFWPNNRITNQLTQRHAQVQKK